MHACTHAGKAHGGRAAAPESARDCAERQRPRTPDGRLLASRTSSPSSGQRYGYVNGRGVYLSLDTDWVDLRGSLEYMVGRVGGGAPQQGCVFPSSIVKGLESIFTFSLSRAFLTRSCILHMIMRSRCVVCDLALRWEYGCVVLGVDGGQGQGNGISGRFHFMRRGNSLHTCLAHPPPLF